MDESEWLDPPLHMICGERHFPEEPCPEGAEHDGRGEVERCPHRTRMVGAKCVREKGHDGIHKYESHPDAPEHPFGPTHSDAEDDGRGEGDARQQIRDALDSYRTRHSRYKGDGGGMQLLDILTPPGASTGVADDELDLLADHIAYELFGSDPATEEDRVEMLRETMDDDSFFKAWEGAEWKLARARTTIRKLKKELTRYYEVENREYREMQSGPTHSDADPSGESIREYIADVVSHLGRQERAVGDTRDDLWERGKDLYGRLRRTEDAGRGEGASDSNAMGREWLPGDPQLTTEEVVQDRIRQFLQERVDHHRHMASIMNEPFRSDHYKLARAYEERLGRIDDE